MQHARLSSIGGMKIICKQYTPLKSGILNDLSAQSALPLSDHFSYVFDTNEQEYRIGKSSTMV